LGPVNPLRRALIRTIGLLSLAPAPSTVCAAVPGETPIGAVLPDVLLEGLNGPPRHLSAYRGRPLLINVWASWCGPCRQEMASLERLAWRADQQYLAIIGISTDDEAVQAVRMLQAINATISQFIDRALRMEHLLGASRLPLTVFVGPDGRVLGRIYGARQWDGPDALGLIDRIYRRAAG